MDPPEAPIAEHGFYVTHFLTVADQPQSIKFYVGILGGKVVRGPDPTYIKLANSWLILNFGGGPTPDKPTAITGDSR
jgi:catechol 2,3-dioxygenase-like lactoylglutathione lyase family enzyme